MGTTTTAEPSMGFRMDQETREIMFEHFLRTKQLSIVMLKCLPIDNVEDFVAQTLKIDMVSKELLKNV